jgi:transcriptional regulator with XRE-family HTH domain
MTFGRIIRDQRKKLGMSQKRLAERIKKEDGASISPQYLNDIEFDRRGPPTYIIDQLAEVLQMPGDNLYLLAGQMPSDLRETPYDSARFEKAFQAFRRELKRGRHG